MDNPIRYQMEMDYLTLLLLISFLNQYLLLYVFSNTVHFCVLQHSSSISGKFLDFIFSTFSFLYFTNVIDILSFVVWCWFSLLLIFLAQFVLCNMNPNYFCWVRVSNFSFCMSHSFVCLLLLPTSVLFRLLIWEKRRRRWLIYTFRCSRGRRKEKGRREWKGLIYRVLRIASVALV